MMRTLVINFCTPQHALKQANVPSGRLDVWWVHNYFPFRSRERFIFFQLRRVFSSAMSGLDRAFFCTSRKLCIPLHFLHTHYQWFVRVSAHTHKRPLHKVVYHVCKKNHNLELTFYEIMAQTLVLNCMHGNLSTFHPWKKASMHVFYQSPNPLRLDICIQTWADEVTNIWHAWTLFSNLLDYLSLRVIKNAHAKNDS